MSTVNPFRFSTKYQDDETDLLYYGHRYYDPSRGSWNSKDPIGEDGGNKLYNYCANDAANAIDALGRWHASVHLWMTIDWSMEAGFTRPSGGDIGVADNDIDSFPTWSPPCPIGQQGRHMKQTKNGMDSRDWYYDDEHRQAINYLRRADRELNAAYCRKAAESFGRGLHSLQDKSSHRDWPRTGPDGNPNGNWKQKTRVHPTWWDAWTDAEFSEPFPKDDNSWWNVAAPKNGWSKDYLPWYGDPEQLQSQNRARATVKDDSTRVLGGFAAEVRKSCVCRKALLQNP